MSTPAPSRIAWLTVLIRLEIALWDRINHRLRAEHDLSLAFFEALYFIARSPGASLRVGELARALRITVGGASKLVDRIEAAGLIRREAVANDRRAARLALTPAGRLQLEAASRTYESELAGVLDGALSPDEQQLFHTLVTRLLARADDRPI